MNLAIVLTLAALALKSLIPFLVAVLVGVVVFYAISLFISDGRILKIIGLIIGVVILIYGLSLIGVVT